MARLLDLPVEIVTHVLKFVTIDDILSLRVASAQFRGIVDANVDSLAYIVARNTFPRARLLLRPPEDGVYDFRWLKSLIPARLAAIVLDKDKCFPWRASYSTGDYIFDGVPAEDSEGDGIRARVANGWKVLQSISNTYRAVYSQPLGAADSGGKIPWPPLSIPGRLSASEKLELEEITRREHAVWIRAVSLVLRLTPADCEDFLLLFGPLVDAFRTQQIEEWRYSWYYDPQGPEIPYFLDCTTRRAQTEFFQFPASPFRGPKPRAPVPKWRHLDRGNAWLTAFLLREGAAPFWEQWHRRPGSEVEPTPDFPSKRTCKPRPDSDTDAHYIRDRIREAWARRSPEVVHVERECAAHIWYAVSRRADKVSIIPPPGYDSLRDSPVNDTEKLELECIGTYKQWFLGQESDLISPGEWSWREWQLGRIGIGEDADLDEDWVKARGPRARLRAGGGGEELFAQFDSLGDVNYYIWL